MNCVSCTHGNLKHTNRFQTMDRIGERRVFEINGSFGFRELLNHSSFPLRIADLKELRFLVIISSYLQSKAY